MLYVFIVSSGCMVKFDMNLAVKKVLELKTEIAKSLLIPVEDQVLLCSGGEELKSDNIVGTYYGAGTDTNPIFLFSKYSNEVDLPYNVPPRAPLDLSIEDDVHNCASMAPSSNTAAVRATLAQRFSEAAVNGRRECDELVHGQHLQQQGWAAVIANLEDAKEALLKRKLHFEELYERYMANRSSYQKIIQTFPSDIDLLSKVPLLPKLMLGSECIEEDLEAEHTLLSWFCSEPLSVLQTLTEKYQRSLDELDAHTLTALNEEICAVLKKTDNPDIKEVRGIEERLSSLNKQIEDAKQLEHDQRELASWFSHTQTRMSRESAVMPDLCGTFQKQLLLMLENHKCLRDILERCTRAKNELSENINYRIKYISRVESEMYDLQVRIIFLEKHVVSVMKQYESFRQVHTAPQRYLELLAEVCRRRVFSSSFMKWATELSAQAFKLYHKEVSIRKGYVGDETKNMVDNLFPGMDDVPPPFAIECPRPFDQKLPNIVREDLEVLRIRFPELAHFCEVPPPDPMPYLSSQVGSDSAFSSNVPSSRIAGDSADFGGRSQKGLSSPHKLAAPAGDCNSEYASVPNEAFSLTSSPFEDPLLPPSNNVELIPKCSKSSEQSADKSVPDSNFESDGDEFETVDPVEVGSHKSHDRKRSASAPRPNSTPEARSTSGDRCLRLSKARSDGDAISPIQERLKHSDSNDFQSTEYYIDDSMPSSYTESNATSPLLRGGQNRMVKSHHMVVAELQKQVDDKNGALVDAVRFIQELQESLQGDLSSLRTYVKEEFWDKMSEVSQIVENINRTTLHLQQQTLVEKEEVKSEAKLLENTYLKRLEVECQKLNDAETQISNYEEYLQKLLTNFEELKHENEQLRSELSHKGEVIKSMLLEQELEMDSLRDQMRQDAQARDDQICRITQTLNEGQYQVESLRQEKENLEEEVRRQLQEKEGMAVLLERKETNFSERMRGLQDEISRLQEPKETAPVQELLSLKDELTRLKSTLPNLKIEMEEYKAKELSELEERLNAKHRDEMESLRSRYRIAVSITSTEKLPLTENARGSEGPEDLQSILDEYRKTWEAEKEECIRKLFKEMLEKETVKHDAEKAVMATNLQREHEENIEKMKSRQMAEMQVSFNEAINSVTKEKDSVIEALRSRVSDLEGNLLSIKVHLDKYSMSQSSSEAALSQSDTGASRCVTGANRPTLVANDLEMVLFSKDWLLVCQSLPPILKHSYKVLHRLDEGQLLDKLRNMIEPHLQILDLDSSDDPKQDDLKKIKLCKSRPCTDCTFKISIFSCDVGDLILLCYEDKHESFVVFHFGQYVHFLHTDSLQPLGLKIPAGPSERWALGVVTNKDFCVTKKPSNRYKINLGAKFYRVKVKPWDREKAHADYQLYHTTRLSAKTDSSTQPSPSSESDSVKGMSASAI